MHQEKVHTMYEGKNIHYSGTDNKLLCSFSSKLCNQRRLNGYGFCIRHILEDPSAPFKRCAYVAKSSNQMCTQAIPKHEERRYCNNHMQVLGMLPKKERKKKEKLLILPENRVQLTTGSSMKPKFSLSNLAETTATTAVRPTPSSDYHDDPYAFPDTGPSDSKSNDILGNSNPSDSILGKSLQSGQGFVRSASDISSTSGLGMSGGSMIAKYYPELAEKLEKMRAKPEPKTTAKSRARSSRTMNKLQTKIAQNKINEKLRKSQELSQTDSNSSPLQMSSPEQVVVGTEQSPSPGPVFSPASSHTSASGQLPQGLTLAGYEQGKTTPDIPPLPHVDTSFLATLAAQDTLGFQNSSASEVAMSSTNRLLSPHTPPRLPPPYPGSSTLSTPSSLTSTDLPSRAFSPQSTSNLNALLESLSSSQSPQRTPVLQVGSSPLTSLPYTPPRQPHIQTQTPPGFLSPASCTSFPDTNNTSAYPFTSTANSEQQNLVVKLLHNHLSSSVPPPNVDIFSLLNISPKQLGVDSTVSVAAAAAATVGTLPQSHMLPSPNTLSAHLSLPPPPPYVPPAVPPKIGPSNLSLPHRTTAKSSMPTLNGPTQNLTVPHAKLHKLSGILSEKMAKRKLKSDLAVKFYSFYAKRKISNHCLVGPYLCSSDEGSEDEDWDMMPWQPGVFSASSDEEGDDDDELENNVPMGMRPTKLSLLKTRLRRQWYQARKASKSNVSLRRNNSQATLALIRCIRDGAAHAVRSLWQIKHMKKSKHRLKKPRRVDKQCCQKNVEEGQCKNVCLPYTNHCLRHIMYNIDQQLFDYCTAKFADNTQCCMPVFDIRHELPLCPVHAAKADNYQKQLEAENKKRPRKKSKPPALTRPPRKGKKKKKGRYSRVAQKALPPAESVGLDSTLSDVDVTGLDTSKPEESVELSSSEAAVVPQDCSPAVPACNAATPVVQPVVETSASTADNILVRSKDTSKALDQELELEANLSPDFDKPFELPLEQASRLLEESDLQEVVNKMPFDALDLFGKNGEPEGDAAYQEHLSVDLTTATKATLEKLLTGTMSEEESMELAIVLAQNLQTDTELAHNAGLISEVNHTSQISQVSDPRMMSGVVSTGLELPNMAGHHMVGVGSGLGLAGSGGAETLVGTTSAQPGLRLMSSSTQNLTMTSGGMAGGGLQQLQTSQPLPPQPTFTQQAQGNAAYENHKLAFQQHQQLQQQQLQQQQQQQQHTQIATSSTAGQLRPSLRSADLNTVYGQIESLTRSQLAAKQASGGVNLNHLMPQLGLDSYSSAIAKTMVRHPPTDSHSISQASASSQNIIYGTSGVRPGYQPAPRVGSSQALPRVHHSNSEVIDQNMMPPMTSVTSHAFHNSSIPASSHTQLQPTFIDQSNFTAVFTSSSSSPSSSLSSSSSSILSTGQSPSSLSSSPSLPKKAKLNSSPKLPSVIAPQPPPSSAAQHHQLMQQHHQLQPQQQHSVTVKNMLQFSNAASSQPIQDSSSNLRLRDSSSPSAGVQSPGVATLSAQGRLTLQGAHALKRSDAQRSNLSLKQRKSQHSATSAKLKLPSSNVLISDVAKSRLSLPESHGAQMPLCVSDMPRPPKISVDSGSGASRLPLLSEKSLSPSTSSSSSSSAALSSSSSSSTTIRHNLFSDALSSCSGMATESISVTVRHPSPLESVPTTVRHTLPDTFPSPVSLPLSPSLPPPPPLPSPASLSLAAQSTKYQTPPSHDSYPSLKQLPSVSVAATVTSTQSSTSLLPELHSVLSSQRSPWPSGAPLPSSLSLQNGLPYASGSSGSRTQLANKFAPAGQGTLRSKQTNSMVVVTDSRLSSLTGTGGVPVVCSPASLSTTAFKSSSSS